MILVDDAGKDDPQEVARRIRIPDYQSIPKLITDMASLIAEDLYPAVFGVPHSG